MPERTRKLMIDASEVCNMKSVGIKCAFDITSSCSTRCAAFLFDDDVSGDHSVLKCRRMGNGGIIGKMDTQTDDD
jgi:hypothetical protein